MIRWDKNELHFQTFSITYLPWKTPRYYFFGYGLVRHVLRPCKRISMVLLFQIRKNLDYRVWFQFCSLGSLADVTNIMHIST